MKRTRFTLLLLAPILWGSLAAPATAQTYPNRPIRIIVPAAAGGVLDVGVRRITDKLARSLGQPIVVDNRLGANGFIGAEAVARAKPDRVIDTDMAAILYTSGSTGKPKGVVLSHRNMVAGAKSVASYLENTSDDTLLAALPLSFDAGFRPAVDCVPGGRARRAHQLSAAEGRDQRAVARARHRLHRRATALHSAYATQLADDRPQPALLREHRRANAARNAEGIARKAAADASVSDVSD